jgi:hypothetical protein
MLAQFLETEHQQVLEVAEGFTHLTSKKFNVFLKKEKFTYKYFFISNIFTEVSLNGACSNLKFPGELVKMKP